MSSYIYLFLTLVHIILWIIIHIYRQEKIDSFDPFYISSGIYALIFVWAPYTWLKSGETSYAGINIMKYLPESTLVFNIGYLFFSIANAFDYIKDKSSKVKDFNILESKQFNEYINRKDTIQFIIRYSWILFLVSIILNILYWELTGRSILFMLSLGQSGDLDLTSINGIGLYCLSYFIRSAIPGLLLLLYYEKKRKILIYFFTYIVLAICTSSGSRNLLICVIFAIVIQRYCIKNERPNIITVIGSTFGLFLLVSIIGMFRTVYKTGGQLDFSNINYENLMRAFMYNVNIFYVFYNLVGFTNEGLVRCHYGLGILNIFIQFIPRAIWPSKPINLGVIANFAMWGEGEGHGGAAYPNIGEFYYELGIIGVIIFMYLFGRILRIVFIKMKDSKNPISIMIFAIAIGGVFQFICRGHFASWAFEFVFMFCPLLYLQHLLKKKYYLLSYKKE